MMSIKHFKRIALIVLVLSSSIYGNIFAQKIKKVTGTAQIKLERNSTKDAAYRKVEQLAIVNAIEIAFGTFVEQETNLTVSSGKSRFNIIGTTKVKGEWIETLDRKFNEKHREVKGELGMEQEIWITCVIKGRVKEATSKANIEVSTLSYPNSVSHAGTFISGDNLYLFFKSPIDGYLSIYIDDGKNIYRILPYNDMADKNTVFVKADKEYIFFSNAKINNYFRNNVDELELFTPLNNEINTLHVLFSESKYYKPSLKDAKKIESGYVFPKSLSRKQFENWLADNKTVLNDFVDKQIHIEILGEE